jgi:LysM repeat protein
MTRPAAAATGVLGSHLRRRLLAATAAVVAACSVAPRRTGEATTVAPATTVATTTTTAPPITYQVRQGDTLTAIARRFGVSVAAIAKANHLTDLGNITEGQVLAIPPAPPVRFVITPSHAGLFAVFNLNLTGAKPAETVLFEIVSPDDRKFIGPPHTATPDGSVSTTYLTTPGDPPGVYKVLAAGNLGTLARADFRIDATNASAPGQANGSTSSTSSP